VPPQFSSRLLSPDPTTAQMYHSGLQAMDFALSLPPPLVPEGLLKKQVSIPHKRMFLIVVRDRFTVRKKRS